MIYVNTVLQTPNINYFFEGGTSFEFTQAPLPQDNIDIYFYRGKRGIDSATVTDVNETVRPGDQLQIRTNDYVGNNDIDDTNPRQVAWDKQKRDLFIYGQPIFKTRDSIESIIRPDPAILAPLTNTSSTFYIESAQLFRYEEDAFDSVTNLENIAGRIYSQPNIFTSSGTEFVPAEPVAVVNASGTVTGINFVNGNNGRGYPGNTKITIAPPNGPGNRATVGTISIQPITGEIAFVQVPFNNSGYDPAKPPTVLIEEPSIVYENKVKINGDFIRGYSSIITQIQGSNGSIRL